MRPNSQAQSASSAFGFSTFTSYFRSEGGVGLDLDATRASFSSGGKSCGSLEESFGSWQRAPVAFRLRHGDTFVAAPLRALRCSPHQKLCNWPYIHMQCFIKAAHLRLCSPGADHMCASAHAERHLHKSSSFLIRC